MRKDEEYMKKRIATLLLVILLTMSNFSFTVNAEEESVNDTITKTATYIKSFYDEYPITYAEYRDVLYLLQSGIECDDIVDGYLASVKSQMDEEGKLCYVDAYSGEETESPAYYAAAAIILAKAGKNGTDFNEYNFIKIIEDYDRDSLLSENVYLLTLILYSVQGYSDYLTDETLEKDLVDKIVSLYQNNENGCGIDNQGISVDTNGKVLPSLMKYYNTDEEVKEIIDEGTSWVLTQQENSNYHYSVEYNEANGDSTALALSLLAVYGDMDDAKKAYEALLTYKSDEVIGAFKSEYADPDLFVTYDAMEGLLAYESAINGKGNIYDISNAKMMQKDKVSNKSTKNDNQTGAMIFVGVMAGLIVVYAIVKKKTREQKESE